MLFYTVEKGDIDKPNNLVMIARHLWPMAVGSAAHVSFEYDENWIDIYDHKPELEEMRIGIIHSHVNMGVFHSGTDMNDLETNCGAYPFYLSVVTNNRTQFEAKIALAGTKTIQKKVKSESLYSFKNSFGKLINKKIKEDKDENETIDVMYIFNVNIVDDKINTGVANFFIDRFDEVSKPKPKFDKNRDNSEYFKNRQTELPFKDSYWDSNTHAWYKDGTPSKNVIEPEEDIDDFMDNVRLVLISMFPKSTISSLDEDLHNYLQSFEFKSKSYSETEEVAEQFITNYISGTIEWLNKNHKPNKSDQNELIIEMIEYLNDYLMYFDYTRLKATIISTIDAYLISSYGD